MRLITLVLAVVALAVAAPAIADKGGSPNGGSQNTEKGNGNGGGNGNKGGGGNGGGGGKSCTPSDPAIVIDNNYGWSQWGSWGLAGQQLVYAVNVMNQDVGCSSSSFIVDVSAPAGFAVSPASTTVSVGSGSSAYVSVYVTSPSSAADGDYPVTATVSRAGDASPSSSFTSYYKVYTTDTTAPTLFWWNPGEGNVVSGRTYNVTVSSTDDHAVRNVELWMDGAYMTTVNCDNVTYICQLHYTWSVGAPGQHTATFRSTDWKGNVGTKTVSFTVG